MKSFNTIWNDTLSNTPQFNILSGDITTDICIIGGGITGISIAYNLQKNNLKYILIEKNKICSSTTQYSTAKITSQHDLIYSSIAKKYCLNFAKLYLEANNNAIENIKNIIDEEKIDCDFEFNDSYVFTQDIAYTKNLNEEYKLLTKLGFKDAELLNSIGIPFDAKYALKFKNQAKFNPKKYTLGLASKICDRIYENTKANKISRIGNKYKIHTDNGDIICNKVVIATHFPIKDIPGFYFLKMHQDMSYIVAADIGKNNFNDMYINVENPTISLRTMKLKNRNILLVGGNGIKTGDNVEENKYTFLEQIAKQMYPDCKILKKWNTQDCITLDQIPYIGQFSNLLPNMYVATGFNKWGISTSNVAANIITDNLLGKVNKYEKVFSATRLHPIKNINSVYYNLNQTVKSLVLNKFKIPKDTIDNIPLSTGKVIKIDNENVGIYKDEQGKVYPVNPFCSHLGCLLTFNIQDKTWDCPCHGSRFDIHGNILNNPANKKIGK